jgi:hypothetical protein
MQYLKTIENKIPHEIGLPFDSKDKIDKYNPTQIKET